MSKYTSQVWRHIFPIPYVPRFQGINSNYVVLLNWNGGLQCFSKKLPLSKKAKPTTTLKS